MSKSGYYSHKCKTDKEKTFIEKEVINCFEQHKGNYGRIRIKKALKSKDIFVSEAKISRILKENELIAKVGRKRKPKKNKPTDEQYLSENLVRDKFEETMPNMLWCTDLSEILDKFRKGSFASKTLNST